MASSYYDLTDVAEVASEDALTVSRARRLVGAMKRQHDYSLIQLLRHPAHGTCTAEYLIVDVECDGVPPKNPVGIQYRERLALCVPNSPKRLVEVLALRRDFPILMHQNQVARDAPPSLCLYFEPPAAVTRTWTPAAFLRRIQWWLEKSARGELHPADQPVEHLFFASRHELILPWNLTELRKNPGQRFAIVRRDERPNGGFTCFLIPTGSGTQMGKPTKHIELTLPPVVHGVVEPDPSNLGELAALLERRSVDFVGPLRAALQADIGEKGMRVAADDAGTIIVLRAPIKRTTDAEPDRLGHRAFFVPIGSMKLGEAVGALVVHEGRYFRDALNMQPSTTWHSQLVLPMDVLIQNDAGSARHQSGVSDEGPTGTLVGAGSLGSALLSLWGRSGWGRWTVIDQDHVKPHNLTRHVAYAPHIGEPKAEVVAELNEAASAGATKVIAVVADACDCDSESVTAALAGAQLIVDASTTLEYPRWASTIDRLPRHFSAFVTPDGNAGVLLAEDSQRVQRLRTLEAQYYRTLIQADWGRNHLSGHPDTFWSGASCRDISVVLPYSRVLNQASNLAEQIQAAAKREGASICIWQRDPVRGAVDVHEVPVSPERRFAFRDLELFIDDGVERSLRDLRRQNLPSETGGVLVGYYDFNIKAVIVVGGLPAPPDSRASSSFFDRGTEGLAQAIADVSKRTGGVVGYIGEWHSHPPGHSASPSGYDLVQLAELAANMADDGLPAVQLIVGEHDLQLLQAEVT